MRITAMQQQNVSGNCSLSTVWFQTVRCITTHCLSLGHGRDDRGATCPSNGRCRSCIDNLQKHENHITDHNSRIQTHDQRSPRWVQKGANRITNSPDVGGKKFTTNWSDNRTKQATNKRHIIHQAGEDYSFKWTAHAKTLNMCRQQKTAICNQH